MGFRILTFLVCFLPIGLKSQMPPPLGKLQLTSASAREEIKINGVTRPERTPVTLAVVPGTYKISIGACPEKQVSVGSGETKPVHCEK
jgi:hypothetical protein